MQFLADIINGEYNLKVKFANSKNEQKTKQKAKSFFSVISKEKSNFLAMKKTSELKYAGQRLYDLTFDKNAISIPKIDLVTTNKIKLKAASIPNSDPLMPLLIQLLNLVLQLIGTNSQPLPGVNLNNTANTTTQNTTNQTKQPQFVADNSMAIDYLNRNYSGNNSTTSNSTSHDVPNCSNVNCPDNTHLCEQPRPFGTCCGYDSSVNWSSSGRWYDDMAKSHCCGASTTNYSGNPGGIDQYHGGAYHCVS